MPNNLANRIDQILEIPHEPTFMPKIARDIRDCYARRNETKLDPTTAKAKFELSLKRDGSRSDGVYRR